MNITNIQKIGRKLNHDKILLTTFLELLTKVKIFNQEHKEVKSKETKFSLISVCNDLKQFLWDNEVITKKDYKFNQQLEEYKTNIHVIDKTCETYLKYDRLYK